MNVEENVPLAPLTTFKVGGPARYLIVATSEDEVRSTVDWARQRSLPLFVLGGGSNLVISDKGWPGLVLRIALRGIEEESSGERTIFHAGAGEDWDAFVARTIQQNCGGVECLSGIPGTVGGTPVQNVGAYGQEVAETIQSVRVLDLQKNEVRELENRDSGFAYRTSIFNSGERGRYIVLRVSFALARGAPPHIEYADLKKFFAGNLGASTLAETRQAVRSIRLSKAMLIVEGDEDCRSAGSFFKNPILSSAQFQELVQCPAARGHALPQFPAGDDKIKVPAAWLVEHAGFAKGLTRGPVGISRKHALAIVNRGRARAAEIISLKNEIQERVREKFGIELHPEPVFVGFES